MVPQPLQLLSSASSSSETASNRCMELIDPNWPFALVSSLATCQRHLWTSVSQNLMYTQYLFRFSFSHVRVTFENLFSFPCPVSFPKSLFSVPHIPYCNLFLNGLFWMKHCSNLISFWYFAFSFRRQIHVVRKPIPIFLPSIALVFVLKAHSVNTCLIFFKLENMDVCLGNSLLIDVQESILQKILPLQSKSNIATCEDFLWSII